MTIDVSGLADLAGMSPGRAAAALARAGFRVVPLWPLTKANACTCPKGERCRTPGKHPRIGEWQHKASRERIQIDRWWSTKLYAGAGIGLVTGGPLRHVVIDQDGAEGAATIAAWEAEHGPLPATFETISGGGADHRHLHFVLAPGQDLAAISNAVKFAPGLDVRAEGGQVVAPPTKHASGERYKIGNLAPLAELPAHVYEKLTAKREPKAAPPPPPAPKRERRASGRRADRLERARAYLQKCEPAIEGQNGSTTTLNTAQKVAGKFELDEGETFDLMVEAYNPMCVPPWPLNDLRRKVREAITKGRIHFDSLLDADRPRPEPVRRPPATSASRGVGDAESVLTYLDQRVAEDEAELDDTAGPSSWRAGRDEPDEQHEADADENEEHEPHVDDEQHEDVLEGLAERVRAGGVRVAFAADVVAAASDLDRASPEFQELCSSLKGSGVNLSDWKRAVAKLREKREREEAKARREAELAQLDGVEAERAEIAARLLVVVNKDGEVRIRQCTANLISIFTHDPDFRGHVAYHVLRESITMVDPIAWHPDDAPEKPSAEWVPEDSTRASAWLSRTWDLDVPTRFVEEAIVTVARKRTVDPLRDYLNGLEHDGVPRLDTWLATYFGADANDYTKAVGSKWMISAVARALEGGCKVDCVLTLEGPQGIKKSSGLRALCADPSWFFDDDLAIGDKDAAQSLRGKWLVELAELASANKAQIEPLKAFITRQVDTYRPSFGRSARDFPRRCVFAASTNADTYLADEQNRRFWPVKCGAAIKVDDIARDRDQLWAEAVARYRKGERWHVDSPELAKLCADEQEHRRHRDPWEEAAAPWLAARQAKDETVTVGQVLCDALKIEPGKRSRQDEMRASAVLRALGWKKGDRRRIGGALLYPYTYDKEAAAAREVGTEVGTGQTPSNEGKSSQRSNRSNHSPSTRRESGDRDSYDNVIPFSVCVSPGERAPGKTVGTVGTLEQPAPDASAANDREVWNLGDEP